MKAFLVFLAGSALAASVCAQQLPTVAKCTAGGDPASPVQRIVGRWKHVELSRYQGDRKLSTTPFPGENILRFECDGTWALVGPDFQSSGTYRWVGPDQLEQKIVDSKIPAQRGQAGLKRIVVDATNLEMHADITAADVNKSGPKARLIKPQDDVHAVSRFERTAAP